MSWWENDPLAQGDGAAVATQVAPAQLESPGNWWDSDPVAKPVDSLPVAGTPEYDGVLAGLQEKAAATSESATESQQDQASYQKNLDLAAQYEAENNPRNLVTGSIPYRAAETAISGVVNKVASLNAGLTGTALEAIGADDLAGNLDTVRNVAQGSIKQDSANQSLANKDSAIGETPAAWTHSALSTILETAGVGTVGGLPGLALWYGATTTDEQLASGRSPAEATAHGLIEGAATYLGGKWLGAGLGKLADKLGGGEVSKTVSEQVAKYLSKKFPINETVAKIAASSSAEAAEEFATEVAHYLVDVANDREKWSAERLWERGKGVIGPSLLAGGLAEGSMAAHELAGKLDKRRKSFPIVAEAIQDAESFDGQAPSESRRKFEKATGKTNTSKVYREAFIDEVARKQSAIENEPAPIPVSEAEAPPVNQERQVIPSVEELQQAPARRQEADRLQGQQGQAEVSEVVDPPPAQQPVANPPETPAAAPLRKPNRPILTAQDFEQRIREAATSPAEADHLVALANANAEYRRETLDEWVGNNIAGVERTDAKNSRYLKHFPDGPPDALAHSDTATTQNIVINERLRNTLLNQVNSTLKTLGLPQFKQRGWSDLKQFAESQLKLTPDRRAISQETIDNIFAADEGSGGKRQVRGEVQFLKDGRAVVRAFKESQNVATLTHELGHVFRRTLLPEELSKAEKSLGVKKGKWDRTNEERFTRMFERYLRDGKAPTKALKGVFEQFKTWLTTVYKNLSKTALREEIPPELREVFDVMLGSKVDAEMSVREPGVPDFVYDNDPDGYYDSDGFWNTYDSPEAAPPKELTTAEQKKQGQRIAALRRREILNSSAIDELESLAPHVIHQLLQDADGRAKVEAETASELQAEYRALVGNSMAARARLRERRGRDADKIPGFDQKVQALRDGEYPLLAAEASARGGGDLENGLYQIMQGGAKQFAEPKADDYIADVLEKYHATQERAESAGQESDGAPGDRNPDAASGEQGGRSLPVESQEDTAGFELAREPQSQPAPAKFASAASTQPDLIPDMWRGSLPGQGGLFEGEGETLLSESPPGYSRSSGQPIGTKHAATETQRAERELPPRKESEPETVRGWDDAAKTTLRQNPDAGREIIEKVEGSEAYVITAKENAVLLNHFISLENEFDTKNREYIDAVEAGDTEAAGALQTRLDNLSDQMMREYAAAEKAGSDWGKAGRSRQMMMERDFSLAAMETRKRAALGGRKLTEVERAELTTAHKEIESLKAKIAENEAKAAVEASEKARQQLIQEVKEPKYAPVVLRYAEKFATFMDKQASSALARFKSRHKNVTLAQEDVEYSEFSPADLADLSIYTAGRITRGATDFAKWSQGMVRDVGEEIRPHLKTIWTDANEQVRKHLDQFAGQEPGMPKKTRKAVLEKTESPESITASVSSESTAAQLSNAARELARYFIAKGVTEREANVDAVHKELQRAMPELTRTETAHAISRYGQFASLNEDPVAVRLREISAELLEVSKIEDMEAGRPPKSTGFGRQPPTDEKRRLAKIVNDLKRKYNIQSTDPARQLASAMQSVKTRLKNQISDLQKQIETREKFLKSKSDLKYDTEAEALREQRDSLKQQFDEIFGKAQMTDARRLELATRAVERGISEYDRRIKEGDFSTTGRPPLSDPQLNALKAKRDTMRKQFQELKALDPASQTVADRKATLHLQRRLAERQERLAERLAKQDFSSESRGKKNGPYDEATSRLQDEVAVLQKRFNDGLFNDRMERRLKGDIEKFKGQISTGITPELTPRQTRDLTPELRRLKTQRDILKRQAENQREKERGIVGRLWAHTGLLRMLQTTGEFSFVGRQGGKQLLNATGAAMTGDIKPAKAFGVAVGRSFKAFANEKFTKERDAAIFNDDRLGEWQDAGLRVIHEGDHISGTEETKIAEWIDRPLVVKGRDINLARKFNRAARVFFNELRTSTYDGLTMDRELTPEQKQRIGHSVNVMTGYGSLGKAEAVAPVLSELLYSPRNLAASFQFLTGQPLWKGDATTRKIIAKQYARTFLGLATFYALAKLAGADIEEDPRSSDFGKLRFGKTRIDPLMGLSQLTVFGTRELTGQRKTQKGDIQSIRGDAPFGGVDGYDVAGSFLRTKLSPNVGLITDLMAGKDVAGQEVGVTAEAGKAVPITYLDIAKAMQEQGVPKGTAMAIAAFFGAGLQTYEPRKSKGLQKLKSPKSGLKKLS